MKILFTTCQIVSFINVDLSLPGFLSDIAFGLEFLQVEIPWECLVPSSAGYIARVYLVSGIPVALIVLIWMAYGVRRLMLHTSSSRRPTTLPETHTAVVDEGKQLVQEVVVDEEALEAEHSKLFNQHSTATLFLL